MSVRKTIIVRSPPPKDEVGDPVLGGNPAIPNRTLHGCRVWPRQSDETEDRGTIIIGGWNVFTLPTTVEITALDNVELDGKIYEIDGTPGFYEGKGYWLILKEVGT